MTVLGLSRGHLVYAKSETEPTTHMVNGPHNIQITQHALDLSLPPARLLGQVSALAAHVAGR